MRELTPEEAAQYEKVAERHPELQLPPLSGAARVNYVRQGLMTFALVVPNVETIGRFGWACFSPIDRKRKVPEKREVGEAVAFNRALKNPIPW